MKPEVILDGVDLSALVAEGGLQYTPEKIWSQNAGRSTSTGEFAGDLIAVKYTVTIQFNRLYAAQFAQIWNMVAGFQAYHTLRFTCAGSPLSVQCYSVSPTGTLTKQCKDGTTFYDGFSIECIGK
jgi:hypothetical protein